MNGQAWHTNPGEQVAELAPDRFRRLSRIELPVCLHWNRIARWRGARSVFQIASRLGDGVFWYTLMAALLVYHDSSAIRPVLHMVVVGLLCTLIYKWLKEKTLRPRPYEVFPVICVAMAPLDRFSFPSGHTLHAVSFSLIACHYYPALIPWLVPFAILVAASRLALGLHYPSDVLAGGFIGGMVATLSLGL
jgi:undecaprenyl-diphosphatase